MKNKSIVFFTNDKESNSKLIELLKSMCNVSVCTFQTESWSEVDLYSPDNEMFVIDDIPESNDAEWVLAKLSEDNVFSTVPVVFTCYKAMYSFEDMGFVSCAYDVLPQPFNYEMTRRRIENIAEIFQLKQQILNLTQIHTKRIMTQANKLKEQSSKIQTMNFDLVELLVAAIESRDLESGQHIKRIRYFTKALVDVVVEACPEYNITKEQAEYICYASSVHDIGKISIPDAIMLKPGRLTREEYEIMKTHTTRGAKLLDFLDEINDSQYFKYCKDICLYHHERWDGKGYPKGLSGDQIPISAQIVAVADCYDALTSDRPYKHALSHQESSELILNGACGAFSPQIMKCFKLALPEFERLEAQLKDTSNSEEYMLGESEALNEPPHEEDVPQASGALNRCDEAILSAYDIIFSCDMRDDFFEVSRGTWTQLFPYIPKNFEEALTQCLRICNPADVVDFSAKVNLDNFKELVKEGKRKLHLEFRAVVNDKDKLILGFLAFGVDRDKNITNISGAFNVYDNDAPTIEVQGIRDVDTLTGLVLENRMSVDVEDYLKRHPESKDLMIFVDIDGMGLVNDAFGYEYGNDLIRILATKLKEINNYKMLVGKSVADKFVVFVEDIPRQSDVVLFIEMLHKKLRKSYQTPTANGEFTVTMGISRYPQDGKNFKQLVNSAGFASEAAKVNGRSVYAFYNSNMRNLSAFASALTEDNTGLYKDSDYEPRFLPVVNKKTGKLVCYDYVPFSIFDDSTPVTAETFYELNKDSPGHKNLSILSIKSLLYMLIGLRDNGAKLPPISVYTILSMDDLPSFVQEMKSFMHENDCSGIDLCIMLPQDFLPNVNIRKLRTFTTIFRQIGLSVGLYLIGDRYIHNNCFIDGVFDRYVMVTDFLEKAIFSEERLSYAIQVINNLLSHVRDLTIPEKVSDSETKKLFDSGCEGFSETLAPISGIEQLSADFEKRGRKATKGTTTQEAPVGELNPDIFLHDLDHSNRFAASYDIRTEHLSISLNAPNILGFDIITYFSQKQVIRVEDFVHPDDIVSYRTAQSKAKIGLETVIFHARLIANDKATKYRPYLIMVACVFDNDGTPKRYQLIFSPSFE